MSCSACYLYTKYSEESSSHLARRIIYILYIRRGVPHILLGVQAREDRFESRRELLHTDDAVAIFVQASHELEDLHSAHDI